MSSSAEGMERIQHRNRSDGTQLLCPAGFPVPPGTTEWVVAKGEQGAKGDKGAKGDTGERGMPPGQRRAIVYLAVLTLLLAAASLLWTAHAVNSSDAAQRQAADRAQAVQHRAGALIEQKICTDVLTMAAIRAPGGNPAANPSRAYEQAEHRAWAGLAEALGCLPPKAVYVKVKPGKG